MKIAVVGSRRFADYDLMKKVLDAHGKVDLIYSGGAMGADTLAQRYAKENGIVITIFYPKYDTYGKKAPLVRNVLIAQVCDEMIAFPMWDSSGTSHVINKGFQLGKKVYIIKTMEDGSVQTSIRRRE